MFLDTWLVTYIFIWFYMLIYIYICTYVHLHFQQLLELFSFWSQMKRWYDILFGSIRNGHVHEQTRRPLLVCCGPSLAILSQPLHAQIHAGKTYPCHADCLPCRASYPLKVSFCLVGATHGPGDSLILFPKAYLVQAGFLTCYFPANFFLHRKGTFIPAELHSMLMRVCTAMKTQTHRHTMRCIYIYVLCILRNYVSIIIYTHLFQYIYIYIFIHDRCDMCVCMY